MEPNFKKINLANGNASLSPKACFDIVFVNLRNFLSNPSEMIWNEYKRFLTKERNRIEKSFFKWNWIDKRPAELKHSNENNISNVSINGNFNNSHASIISNNSHNNYETIGNSNFYSNCNWWKENNTNSNKITTTM